MAVYIPAGQYLKTGDSDPYQVVEEVRGNISDDQVCLIQANNRRSYLRVGLVREDFARYLEFESWP